jgi:hypothetical protein
MPCCLMPAATCGAAVAMPSMSLRWKVMLMMRSLQEPAQPQLLWHVSEAKDQIWHDAHKLSYWPPPGSCALSHNDTTHHDMPSCHTYIASKHASCCHCSFCALGRATITGFWKGSMVLPTC